MGVISVAIADDNERMVEILDSIVKNDNDIQIVGKANNGEDVYLLRDGNKIPYSDIEEEFNKEA